MRLTLTMLDARPSGEATERTPSNAVSASRRAGAIAWSRRDALLLGVAVAASLAVLIPHLAAPGFFHNDEAQHAVSGAFCRDALADFATFVCDPVGYAATWYAHFPGMVIPFYYPPLVHGILGVAFLVGGVSLLAARLVIVAFAIWGVVFLFLTLRLLVGRTAALAGPLLLVSIPEVTLWGHSVMLEVPMTAMVITAAYFLVAYVECDRRRAVYGWAVFTLMALMTKQPALFFLPVSMLYVLLRGRWSLLRRRECMIAVGVVVLVTIAYVFFQAGFARVFVAVSVNSASVASRLSWSHFASYPSVFWQMAPATTLLAIVGAGVGWRRGYRAAVVLGMAWLLGFLLFQTAITGRSARYAVPAMPALAMLGGMICVLPHATRGLGAAAVLTAIVLQASVGWSGRHGPAAVQGQFAEAADAVFRQRAGRVVLYEGYHDGEFIFNARRIAGDRRPFVLRSSKVIYSCATDPGLLFSNIRSTDQEIYDLLDRTGVTHVVVEEPQRIRAPGTCAIRRMVASDRFTKEAEYEIAWPGRCLRRGRLEIYAYHRTTPAGDGRIVLPLPGVGRELRVSSGGPEKADPR